MKEIPLSQGKFALVDDEDFECLNHFTWCTNNKGRLLYARTSIAFYDNENKRKYKTILMHRMILKASRGTIVDHNGLNNCKSNLRLCTDLQNQGNRRPNKNKKYRGISKMQNGKFQVYLNRKYIGYYSNECDAVLAYNQAASDKYKEFANLNILTQ